MAYIINSCLRKCFKVFVLPLLLFPCASAHAQYDDVNSLTQQNVRAFIAHTSKMSKPESGDFASLVKIQRFLQKHLADNSRFTSTLTYHIPSMPEQSMSMTFDKDKFIDTVKEGAEAVEGYNNTVQVLEVKVANGGKRAFVKSKNTETGFMSMPTGDNGDGGQLVPIEGNSTCAQVVELNDEIIQIVNAVCKTDIEFKE